LPPLFSVKNGLIYYQKSIATYPNQSNEINLKKVVAYLILVDYNL